MMALPVELCLQKENGDYFICLRPVKEVEKLRKGHKNVEIDGKCKYLFSEENGPKEVNVSIPWQEEGEIELILYGKAVHIDFDTQELFFESNRACIPEKESFCLQVFLDFGAIEIFAQEGRVYLPCAWDIEELEGEIAVCNETLGLAKATVFEL